MVYMKLIVSLGCLAATSLALPALPLSKAELAARQCIDRIQDGKFYADDVSPACLCQATGTKGCGSTDTLVLRQFLSSPSGLVRYPPIHSSISATDHGGVSKLEAPEGAPSTQDPSKISSCMPSPTSGRIDFSGSCDKVIKRGLSDHLNPTIPDEDEEEE